MPSDLTQEPLVWKDGGLGGGCHRGEHRERPGVDCGSYAAALLRFADTGSCHEKQWLSRPYSPTALPQCWGPGPHLHAGQ